MTYEDKRTAIAKAQGLGASHGGTEHFIHQRVSAIAILLLGLLLSGYLLFNPIALEQTIAAYIAHNIVVSGTLFLLVATITHHMRLGMQTVVEDYIHTSQWKVPLLIANSFFCYGIMAITFICLIKITFISSPS